MDPLNSVTTPRFFELTYYSDKAVRAMMADGTWLEGRIWRKAPMGRF
jgi:hypothetical protein